MTDQKGKHRYPGQPDPHVQVHNDVFESLLHWAGTMSGLRVILYVARDSWGYGVSQDREGRKWTHTSFSPAACGLAIGVSRPNTSVEYHKLLRSGILKRRADGRVSIDKYKLAEHCRPLALPNAPPLAPANVSSSERSLQLTKALATANGERKLQLTEALATANAQPLYKQEPVEVTATEIQKTEIQKTLQNTTCSVQRTRKTRAPTEVEKTFIDGFRNCYGHEPEIGREHAIRLNQLTTKHGPQLVAAKIVAWWQSSAGQWCKGNRTIGAFLHAFDQVTVGINPHDGIAVARAILAQRRAGGGNGTRRGAGSARAQLPDTTHAADDSLLGGAMQDADVVGGSDS